MRPDPAALAGTWIHAHEEDEGDRMVFRKKGASLPPSRGRVTLQLDTDGGAALGGLAPGDGPATQPGRWSLKGRQVEVETDSGQASSWTIEEHRPDRLVLRQT